MENNFENTMEHIVATPSDLRDMNLTINSMECQLEKRLDVIFQMIIPSGCIRHGKM